MLTIRKTKLAGKNPIDEVDFKWIFARICKGTEQIQIIQQCSTRDNENCPFFEQRTGGRGHRQVVVTWNIL